MPPFSHETTAHDDSLDDECHDRDEVRAHFGSKLAHLRAEMSHPHARDDDDDDEDSDEKNEMDPREELDDIAEEADEAGMPEVAALAKRAETITAPDVARTMKNFLDKTIAALEKLIAEMEAKAAEERKKTTSPENAREKTSLPPSRLLADGKKAFEKYSGNMKEKETNLFEYSTGYFTINLNPQFSIQNNQWRVRWRTSEDWKDPGGVVAPFSLLNNSKAEIDDIVQALAKANAEYTLALTTAASTQAPMETQATPDQQNPSATPAHSPTSTARTASAQTPPSAQAPVPEQLSATVQDISRLPAQNLLGHEVRFTIGDNSYSASARQDALVIISKNGQKRTWKLKGQTLTTRSAIPPDLINRNSKPI